MKFMLHYDEVLRYRGGEEPGQVSHDSSRAPPKRWHLASAWPLHRSSQRAGPYSPSQGMGDRAPAHGRDPPTGCVSTAPSTLGSAGAARAELSAEAKLPMLGMLWRPTERSQQLPGAWGGKSRGQKAPSATRETARELKSLPGTRLQRSL